MGTIMESETALPNGAHSLRVRLLGSLAISRDELALRLPGSRKVRALFAYLALAERAVTRSHLCELLWDVPNDPRSELRWCLSKIRGVIEEPGRRRIEACNDTIRVDLSDCAVDAVEVIRAAHENPAALPPERLRKLIGLFAGDFGEGLEIDRSPAFNGWLVGQRRRFRAIHASLLESLIAKTSDGEAFAYFDEWLKIAPYDEHAHELLLRALARQGRIREGEEHLAATSQLFDAEGLDSKALRTVWRAAKAGPQSTTAITSRLVTLPPAPESSTLDGAAVLPSRRASIAVMPFFDLGIDDGFQVSPADGLVHDIITRLAKLRSLFVIAQGTVFALRDKRIGPEEAGRVLNVHYVVSGSLKQDSNRLSVSVELTETRSARVVWAEVFINKRDETFLVLDEIGNRIVACIASEIETVERNRAILLPPSSLDAWEAHHRGLWHMYRLNKSDNEHARHFFQTAVRLDPTFSRAYAGLSFTHWQSAFQGWAKRGPEIDRAFEAAGQSLMADDRDPAAHWAMGRALWLRGSQKQSLMEFERSVELSPNFAVAHYNVAFVNATAGSSMTAIESSDHAQSLSPFDPMLFGMLGATAMALVRLGRFEEAAEWAIKAAARPNAFAHILAIAAFSLALAGRVDEGRAYLDTIHRLLPHYRVGDLITAMQFDQQGVVLFQEGARRLMQAG
ncbi:BTAD domain-containing putative transcriptional regulator [Aquibaculum sediminis]|uniref:BTAD domain-containing putative transcriptional regulator n=1 Tax=Aquibaculum sediminis TaxID=3231907 RepID=UPI00345127BB